MEEGQNIDEMAQEVEVLIESFGPPEKSALPETSSKLLVEDYQKGHKHFRLNQLISYFSLLPGSEVVV